MGCRLEERKLYQEMTLWERSNSDNKEFFQFINAYADIAEGKADETQVDNAFAMAKAILDRASAHDSLMHRESSDIGRGIYHRWSGKERCDVDGIMGIMKDFWACSVKIDCPPKKIVREAKRIWEVTEHGVEPSGESPYRMQDAKEILRRDKMCLDMGCDPDTQNEATIKQTKMLLDCGGNSGDLEHLFHYDLSKSLFRLKVDFGIAKTRKDKVLAIDMLVNMQHHGGRVWEYASLATEDAYKVATDTLNCLAGFDSEKYEPD